MKRLLYSLSFIAVLAIVLILPRPGESREPLPAIKKNCGTCHLSHDMKSSGLRVPLSDLCLECHPDRQSPSDHEVDILPSMPVNGLPLFDGRMTCATCHDPHGKSGEIKMLRYKPTVLCKRCHPF